MAEYVLFTESTTDLSVELVKELGIEVLPMRFTLDGTEYNNYPDNRELSAHDFYDQLRAGGMGTTSQIIQAAFEEAFTPVLEAGKDILYLSFSSGLSGTFQSARLAAEELAEKYPQRTVRVLDTLQASMGEGLAVYYAATMKNEGKSLEEVADWFEANKMRVCAWFTVDDLMFLKRGGRLGGGAAVVGTLLGIKPILHVDDEGHLIKVGTARGRSAALKALVEHMAQTAEDPAGQTVFISHGDCRADAEKVAAEVKARFGVQDVVINYVGPVIGAHSGPGTLALFFLGSKR